MTILDWIFEGIVTWISSIASQIMDAVSGLFLNALGTDMVTMEEYFPFITKAFDVMQYTAWAVLFLIVVWQLFRAFGGPITEAENPWQLVVRGAIFALLIGLKMFSVEVTPNFFWYLFCGFCLALSVIAPGMSFSTLLMPLGLYTPFIDGIGHFDLGVLIPGGIGALVTVICLAKAINALFDNYYSIAFHGIIGIVIAATVMIIPFSSFTVPSQCLVNVICLVVGIAAALALDKFNSRVTVE